MAPDDGRPTAAADHGTGERPGTGADVILLGDSHVQALHQGCAAAGIRSVMLKSGGIHWNEGKIRVHPPARGKTPFLPALKPRVKDIEARLGLRDIFDSGLPVVASIGFHCGHLARAFGDGGQVAWPPPADLEAAELEETLFASRAVLDAFVEEHRARHFALLEHIA